MTDGYEKARDATQQTELTLMRDVVDRLIETVRADAVLGESAVDYEDALGEPVENGDEDVVAQLLEGRNYAKAVAAAAAEVARELEDRFVRAIGSDRVYRTGDTLWRAGSQSKSTKVREPESFFAAAFDGDAEAADRAQILFNPNNARKTGVEALGLDFDEHFEAVPGRYGVASTPIDRSAYAVPESEIGLGPKTRG